MTQFFKQIGTALLGVFTTAAGFLGFVAVVGGLTVWFRFYTAELPHIQAIDAMPRSELLVNGAAPLILFGVLGVIAVTACYAIDRCGRAREAMAHGLVVLFAFAAGYVILVSTDAALPQKRPQLLGVLVTGWVLAHIVLAFGRHPFEHGTQKFPTEEDPNPPLEPPPKEASFGVGFRLLVLLVVALVPVAGSVALLVVGGLWWRILGAALLVASLVALGGLHVAVSRTYDPEPEDDADPNRFMPFWWRWFVLLIVLLVEAFAIWRLLDEDGGWVAGAVLAGAGLGVLIFRVADSTGPRFAVFGIALFFSIPLFGALVNLMRLRDVPLVQPAALIRDTPEGRLVVQGLFIAEKGDRVYLGSVATDGCRSSTLKRRSGFIFSIPSDKVLAMKVGRLQSVELAIAHAPQLAQLLVRTVGSFPDPRLEDERKKPKGGWPLRLTNDRAIREEPSIEEAHVISAHPPMSIATVMGERFGRTPGRVLVGGRRARLIRGGWRDERITFYVPKGAKTSRVSVECPQPGTVLQLPEPRDTRT